MASRCAALLLLLAVFALAASPAAATSDYIHPMSLFRHDRVLLATNTTNTSINSNCTELTFNTTANDQWCNVTYTGIGTPDALTDFIAVYPADANLTRDAPIKYKYLNSTRGYNTTGSGSALFQMINLRKDMKFVLFTNNTDRPVFVAQSAVIPNKVPNKPEQGHLSLTNVTNEMQVTWTTRNASNPVVRWGLSRDNLSNTANATTRTYTKSQLCGAPSTGAGYLDPGVFHTGKMTLLNANTRYYYQYGSSDGGFSNISSFISPPPSSPNSSISILFVVDLGQTMIDGSNQLGRQEFPSYNTSQRLAAENATLCMLPGDISYADGYLSDWDQFGWQLEPLATKMPLMTGEGNHERDAPNSGDVFTFINSSSAVVDSRGECGVVYTTRFNMPTQGPQTPNNTWYSFDYGPVHVLSYDTEMPFVPGTPQYQFMISDLQSVDRSRTPWVVLIGHRPIYEWSFNNGTIDSDIDFMLYQRSAFEDILFRYQVDFTVHGHTHVYQRSCAQYNGTCIADNADGTAAGVRYIIAGNGGRPLNTDVIMGPKPVWNEITQLEYGYLRANVTGTEFRVQSVSSATGRVLDDWTLRKPANWVYAPRDVPAAVPTTNVTLIAGRK